MHLDDSPDPEKVMELMQEEDRRSGSVTCLGSWVFGNFVFYVFETTEIPPSRRAPTTQQQYYFDQAHKLFIWFST